MDVANDRDRDGYRAYNRFVVSPLIFFFLSFSLFFSFSTLYSFLLRHISLKFNSFSLSFSVSIITKPCAHRYVWVNERGREIEWAARKGQQREREREREKETKGRRLKLLITVAPWRSNEQRLSAKTKFLANETDLLYNVLLEKGSTEGTRGK